MKYHLKWIRNLKMLNHSCYGLLHPRVPSFVFLYVAFRLDDSMILRHVCMHQIFFVFKCIIPIGFSRIIRGHFN